MSMVSSPALPSMVIVLKLRLVAVKSPITWMVSPLLDLAVGQRRIVAVVGGGVERIDGDFLDIVEFGDNRLWSSQPYE